MAINVCTQPSYNSSVARQSKSNGHQVKFKSQQSAVEGLDTPLVRESKDHIATCGKALNYNPANDCFVVENQNTGKVENWPKKESLPMQGYLNKKEKQLTVAAQIISYQAAKNEELEQENQELKAQLGKKLNIVG